MVTSPQSLVRDRISGRDVASPRSFSRWVTVAMLCTAGFPLEQGHAAMRGSATRAHAVALDTTIAPPDSGVTVAQIRGQAFRIKAGGVYAALRSGGVIPIGEPVGVGGKSRMDLRVGDDGVLDLGPGARLTLQPETDSGSTKAALSFRLEQGYLRVRLKDAARPARLQVSFGDWAALLEPGEYVFDAREPESSVCTLGGVLHMSGVPGRTPASVSSGCVLLGAQAPTTVTLGPADLKRVQDRRALQPVVAEVNWREVKNALARVDAEVTAGTHRKSSEAVSAIRLTDDNAESLTSPRIEAQEVAAIPDPLQIMPRTRRSAIVVRGPISLAPLEAMVRRVERHIAREQAKLADALVASAEQAQEAVPVQTPTSPTAPAPVDVPMQPVLAAESPHEVSLQSKELADSGHIEARPLAEAAAMKSATPPDVHSPGPAAIQPTLPAPVPRSGAPNLHLALDSGLGTLKSGALGGPTVVATSGDANALVSEPVRSPSKLQETTPAPPTEASRRSESPPGPQIDKNAHGTVQGANAVLSNPLPGSPNDPLARAPAPVTPPLEWIVNVATFPSLESAEQQAEQLRSQHLATGIRSETVRGRSAYRVVIEGLATEDAANKVLSLLVSRLGLRQAWAFRKS